MSEQQQQHEVVTSKKQDCNVRGQRSQAISTAQDVAKLGRDTAILWTAVSTDLLT